MLVLLALFYRHPVDLEIRDFAAYAKNHTIPLPTETRQIVAINGERIEQDGLFGNAVVIDGDDQQAVTDGVWPALASSLRT